MNKIRKWWRRANKKKTIEFVADFIAVTIFTAIYFISFCGVVFILDTFKDNVWQTTINELTLMLISSYFMALSTMMGAKYRKVNEKYRTLLEMRSISFFNPKKRLAGKEIVGGGIGCGKTNYLIKRSNDLKIPIMTATHEQAANIIFTAKHMGIDIPEPVIANSVRHMQGKRNKTVLVDEIEMVLGSLTGVNIETASSSYNLIEFGGMDDEAREKAESSTM